MKLWNALKYHAEWLLLPLFLLSIWLALHAFHWLTGRPPVEDPTEIISTSYVAVRVALVVGFTGFTQGRLFGWRGDEPGATRGDHILDSLCTLALLSFFAACFWH